MFSLVRLHTDIIVNMTKVAQRRYDEESQIFEDKYKNKDKHYDFIKMKTILAHNENALVYNPEKGKLPWYTNECLIWFLDLFLLGWICDIILETNTFKVEYELKKLVLK